MEAAEKDGSAEDEHRIPLFAKAEETGSCFGRLPFAEGDPSGLSMGRISATGSPR